MTDQLVFPFPDPRDRMLAERRAVVTQKLAELDHGTQELPEQPEGQDDDDG
jgi:hypothetical protein